MERRQGEGLLLLKSLFAVVKAHSGWVPLTSYLPSLRGEKPALRESLTPGWYQAPVLPQATAVVCSVCSQQPGGDGRGDRSDEWEQQYEQRSCLMLPGPPCTQTWGRKASKSSDLSFWSADNSASHALLLTDLNHLLQGFVLPACWKALEIIQGGHNQL